MSEPAPGSKQALQELEADGVKCDPAFPWLKNPRRATLVQYFCRVDSPAEPVEILVERDSGWLREGEGTPRLRELRGDDRFTRCPWRVVLNGEEVSRHPTVNAAVRAAERVTVREVKALRDTHRAAADKLSTVLQRLSK